MESGVYQPNHMKNHPAKTRFFSLVSAICLASASTANAVSVTSVFSFNGTNGATPSADLLCLSNGLIYGTTSNGGTTGNGTVFVFNPASQSIVSEFSFAGTNGNAPVCALIQGQDGNLYGTTYNGNPGAGYPTTVFRISTSLVFTNIYTALGGIKGPACGVTQWTNGSLFGLSLQGGSFASGELFSLTTNGTSFAQFTFGGIGATGNGADPWGRLTLASSGTMYGTTSSSGSNNNHGTIFKLTSGSTLSTIFSFNGTNGSQAVAPLLVGSDGYLYGTTYAGGSNGYGCVFKFNPTNSAMTTLYSFANGSDGANPAGELFEVTNGIFYGTTSSANGGIYQITSGGAFSTIASLSGTNGSGSLAGLARATDGNLYGTTALGGIYGKGTIFRVAMGATLNTTPPVFQQATIANGMFTVNATAVTGQSYQVQYKTNLSQPSWSNLGSPITASNGSIGVSDTITATPKLYRVQLVP